MYSFVLMKKIASICFAVILIHTGCTKQNEENAIDVNGTWSYFSEL